MTAVTNAACSIIQLLILDPGSEWQSCEILPYSPGSEASHAFNSLSRAVYEFRQCSIAFGELRSRGPRRKLCTRLRTVRPSQ